MVLSVPDGFQRTYYGVKVTCSWKLALLKCTDYGILRYDKSSCLLFKNTIIRFGIPKIELVCFSENIYIVLPSCSARAEKIVCTYVQNSSHVLNVLDKLLVVFSKIHEL